MSTDKNKSATDKNKINAFNQLFSIQPVVNLQGTVAGKRFEADIARGGLTSGGHERGAHFVPIQSHASAAVHPRRHHHWVEWIQFGNVQTCNEWMNESINKSINESKNQSINESINESIKQSMKQSINDEINEWINMFSCFFRRYHTRLVHSSGFGFGFSNQIISHRLAVTTLRGTTYCM